MKIRALRLYNVRRFEGCGTAIENIGDGVNVLCAPNETGKSTSFEALHALFFLPYSTTQRKEVQNLRPYSGGHPLIEVDITTQKGSFRISKQFFGKSFVRVEDLQQQKLLAQADEAENFIAKLVRERIGNPAGLLWVRQGINVLEKHNNTQGTQEQQARMGLLQSVQSEVDAVTGGRRMHAIMERVAIELDALITTKGAKAGGRYALAIERVERLDVEEQRLSAEVAALRQALDARSKLQKRLAECEEPQAIAERQQEIKEAQAVFDEAKLHHEKVKTVAAQLELARKKHELAKQKLENFRQKQAQQIELQAQFHAIKPQREEIAEKRRAIGARFEQVLQEQEQAENNLQILQNQMSQIEALRQIGSLKQNLTQAQNITAAINQAQQARIHISITPEDGRALYALDIEIARLRAMQIAKQPSFTIQYHNNAPHRIKWREETLEEGQEYFYEEQTQLEIPQIGTIILRAHKNSSPEANLLQTEEKRQKLLNALGVKDFAEAQIMIARAQELDTELARWQAQIFQLAPLGITALQTQIAALEKKLEPAPAIMQDLEHIKEQWQIYEQRQNQARLEAHEIHLKKQTYDQEFVTLEGQLAALHAELAHGQATLGQGDEQKIRHDELLRHFEAMTMDLNAVMQRFEILRDKISDFDAAKIRLHRLQSAEEATKKEINNLRESLAGLNAVIATKADQAVEETLHELREKQETARRHLAAEEAHLAALQRLNTALMQARARAHDLYLMPIMRELKPLLKLIFNDISIHFDEKTLLPQRILRDGRHENIEHLSGGMREQISILTRLAFARLLAHNGTQVPVILDDSLVYCDDDRIEKMFDILHHQADNQQIIVFSCRARAFARLGGNVLHMRDWHPQNFTKT